MVLPLLSTGLVALAVSVVLTPLIMLAMVRIGVVDRPDGRRKLHGREVPLAGGLAVWMALVAAVWGGHLFGAVAPPADGWFWTSFLLATCLLCIVGLADDAWSLRGRHKLLGQIAAVSLLVGSGLVIREVHIFGWGVQLGIVAAPFTVFWLLGAINAMNLIDGMDGLASTVGGMIGLAFCMMAAMTGHFAEAAVAAALVGGVLGFLVYNFPPAKVFLGDTGSMVIGLVLGVIAIRSTLKGPATLALAAPVAIWTLPILDVSMAILRRKLTGRSIYATDRGHLHHRLGQRGLSTRASLGLVASLCAVTTVGALASVAYEAEWIAPASAAVVAAFLILTRLFGHSECALLARRTQGLAISLLPSRGRQTPPVHEHRSQLQGTWEWDDLWESLILFADRVGLDSVQLDVSVPAVHEEFYASWRRAAPAENGRPCRVDIPLYVPRVGSVGALRVAGVCRDDSACGWMGEMIDGLRSFETQVSDLLISGYSIRLTASSRPKHAGESGSSEGIRHSAALAAVGAGDSAG